MAYICEASLQVQLNLLNAINQKSIDSILYLAAKFEHVIPAKKHKLK